MVTIGLRIAETDGLNDIIEQITKVGVCPFPGLDCSNCFYEYICVSPNFSAYAED